MAIVQGSSDKQYTSVRLSARLSPSGSLSLSDHRLTLPLAAERYLFIQNLLQVNKREDAIVSEKDDDSRTGADGMGRVAYAC